MKQETRTKQQKERDRQAKQQQKRERRLERRRDRGKKIEELQSFLSPGGRQEKYFKDL
jgi:hypothetical protein